MAQKNIMSNLLKSKILLGVMIVVVAIFAVGLFTSSASAATCTVSTPMKQGVKSADVSCLQSILGVTPQTGYFGTITKAKVMAFQTNQGLVADGIVGPATRAKLNYTSGTGIPTGDKDLCPNGMTLASNCTLLPNALPNTGALCPNGYLIANNCAAGGTVVTTGEGSATLDYEAIPASGVSIYTGRTQQAGVTFKIKATGSNMNVSRLWLDVDKRIWLDASTAYVMDGSTILATLPLNSSTVSEITTGSKWQLQFNGLNVNVPVGTTKDLTVAFDRPTVTQNNDTVTIATSSTIRATDTAGFSNTYDLFSAGTRTMSFSSSAATTGTLTSSLNVNAPAIQSVSGLSSTVGVFTPVKLMDFDLKGQNSPITVTTLYGTVASSAHTVGNMVASVELRDGTLVLGSQTPVAGVVTFSSLNIVVPQDGTKTLSIWAQMNPIGADAAGYTYKGDGIKFTLTPTGHTVAYDGSFNTVTDSTASVVGTYQYMFKYAPTLTFSAAVPTQIDESTSTTINNGGQYSMALTITAPSGSDIYFNTPSLAVGATYAVAKYGSGGGTLAVTTSISGTTLNGTTLATWDKISAGSSRTITINGYIPHGSAAGFVGIALANSPGINWTDTDSASNTVVQTWGLTDFHTGTVHVTNN
jgi:hypothetical protein